MCSKVLNGHIILTDTSITTILAPEMTYTPKIIPHGSYGSIICLFDHLGRVFELWRMKKERRSLSAGTPEAGKIVRILRNRSAGRFYLAAGAAAGASVMPSSFFTWGAMSVSVASSK